MGVGGFASLPSWMGEAVTACPELAYGSGDVERQSYSQVWLHRVCRRGLGADGAI